MNARCTHPNYFRSGGALLSVVIGLMLVSILGATMAGLLYRSGHGSSVSYDLARAYYLAESGMSYARVYGNLKRLADEGETETIDMGGRTQFTISVTQSNNVYRVESVGSTGIGTRRETHRRITRGGLSEEGSSWNPDVGPPPVEVSPVGPVVDDFDGGTLDNFQVAYSLPSLDGFAVVSDPHDGGNGGSWIETDMTGRWFMSYDEEDDEHYIGQQNLYFDNMSTLATAWEDNSFQISYEVQVKMAWSADRQYGAQGLAVMLESRSDDLSEGKSEGFYVSFMRYHDDMETGQYKDTVSHDYDGIPNSIKPPGLAGHRLLVVWHQWSDGKKREWLAYKDLDHYSESTSPDSVDWVMDWNDGSSGACFKDYSTIAARVIEADAPDKKYRYLQVLRADPKTGVARAANTLGDDINKDRLAYLPQAYGGSFPRWSPIDFDFWQAELDYFTLEATLSDDPLKEIAWDGVNDDPHAAIVIMPDHGTIRTEEYTRGDSGDWNDRHYEIGLHVLGNFSSVLDNEVYFDEFAVRFLKSKPE